MWQKFAKFKGAEYFRKALYLQHCITHPVILWLSVFECVTCIRLCVRVFSLSVFLSHCSLSLFSLRYQLGRTVVTDRHGNSDMFIRSSAV